jgi:hypothetical protein
MEMNVRPVKCRKAGISLMALSGARKGGNQGLSRWSWILDTRTGLHVLGRYESCRQDECALQGLSAEAV